MIVASPTMPPTPSALTSVPWFLPGVVVSVGLALVLAPRLAQLVRAPAPVAGLLVASVGTIVSATLTPLYGTLERAVGSGWSCDLERIGLAPARDLLRFGDVGLNVVLFVPLGVSIALLPRSGRTLVVALAAAVLPLAIELTQMAVPPLGRGCESADVADNLTGFGIGLAIGLAGRVALPGVRSRLDRGATRRP